MQLKSVGKKGLTEIIFENKYKECNELIIKGKSQ